MSDFSNITVAHQDDDKVALLVDGKPISNATLCNLKVIL